MRRVLLILAGVALLASACAKASLSATSSGGTIPPGSRGTKEVTVYPSDSGKTIMVVERQSLVFERDPKEKGARTSSYEVGSFPDFLTLESGDAATQESVEQQPPFRFSVDFAGRGDLIIIQSVCPPSQADDTMPCPLAGPGGAPLRQIIIHIMAQGRGV